MERCRQVMLTMNGMIIWRMPNKYRIKIIQKWITSESLTMFSWNCEKPFWSHQLSMELLSNFEIYTMVVRVCWLYSYAWTENEGVYYKYGKFYSSAGNIPAKNTAAHTVFFFLFLFPLLKQWFVSLCFHDSFSHTKLSVLLLAFFSRYNTKCLSSSFFKMVRNVSTFI